MGFLSVLGTIGGAIGGSFLGAPSAGAAIGGSLGGAIEGNSSARAAQRAAQTTAAATQSSIDLDRQMYEENVARQQPWLQAGQLALNRLIPDATSYTPFGMNQFQTDPGYAFRMSEGMKGIERSAAARGGLLSGSTLKGIQQFGQDMGSQEYMNAFNRYQTERNARLAPLQSLAGVGQTTSQQLGASGANYGQNVGNALLNQAYTTGNAGIAAASARNSAYGDMSILAGQVPSDEWTKAGKAIRGWF